MSKPLAVSANLVSNLLTDFGSKTIEFDGFIDPERIILEPDPLTPALSQRERVRTGHDEIKTSSCRINRCLPCDSSWCNPHYRRAIYVITYVLQITMESVNAY